MIQFTSSLDLPEKIIYKIYIQLNKNLEYIIENVKIIFPNKGETYRVEILDDLITEEDFKDNSSLSLEDINTEIKKYDICDYEVVIENNFEITENNSYILEDFEKKVCKIYESEKNKSNMTFKQFAVKYVSIEIPIKGNTNIVFRGPFVYWNEIQNVSDYNNDYGIVLNDISYNVKNIYFLYNEPLTNYYLYTLGIFFQEQFPPTIVISDWLCQYLNITKMSNGYKVNFSNVPDGINIPSYNDLENINIPASSTLIQKIRNEGTMANIDSDGPISFPAIISSFLLTRYKIISISESLRSLSIKENNDISTINSSLSTLVSSFSTLESQVSTLVSSVSMLESQVSTINSRLSLINNNFSPNLWE